MTRPRRLGAPPPPPDNDNVQVLRQRVEQMMTLCTHVGNGDGYHLFLHKLNGQLKSVGYLPEAVDRLIDPIVTGPTPDPMGAAVKLGEIIDFIDCRDS